MSSSRKLPSLCAFTLVELLVAVAILAVVALIATASLDSARIRTRVGVVKTDFAELRRGIEAYATANGRYPRMTSSKPPYNDRYTGLEFDNAPLGGTLGYWLTTPIAFTARFDLVDPFSIPNVHSVNDRLYSYNDYHNLIIMAPVPSGFYSSYHEQFRDVLGEYLLWSVGPDQDRTGAMTPYDPTNGLRSYGNIVYSQKRQFDPPQGLHRAVTRPLQ